MKRKMSETSQNDQSSKRKIPSGSGTGTTTAAKSFKRYKKSSLSENILEQHEANQAKRLELQTQLNKLKAPFNGEIKFPQVRDALEYIKDLFPSKHFADLPPIIYLNQLYSLVRNRTECDREIELLRSNNQIRLFKSDSKEFQGDDVFICFTDDLKRYLETVILPAVSGSSEQSIKNYLNKILTQTNEIFIKKSELKNKFRLTETDVTTLVQLGLFAIKDANDLWFSIPSVGKFRRVSLESRRLVTNLMNRKKYHEMNVEELVKRNIKNLSQLGIPYLVLDLIGSSLVKRVDSPLDAFIIQLI